MDVQNNDNELQAQIKHLNGNFITALESQVEEELPADIKRCKIKFNADDDTNQARNVYFDSDKDIYFIKSNPKTILISRS